MSKPKIITNNKIEKFIYDNFPKPNNITVLKTSIDNSIVELDYGKAEPKLKVTLESICEGPGSFRLAETKLID